MGGHAFTDYCYDCVEGNTGLEEGGADLGCGCDELAPATYCEDTDGDELGNPETEGIYCLNEIVDEWDGTPVEDCTDIFPNCDCLDNEYNECFDCLGDCGGDAVIDDCGVCGGTGDCACPGWPDGTIQDCNGDCGGDAFIDESAICSSALSDLSLIHI